MSNSGRVGENLFNERMAARGNKVTDVSGDSRYFSLDIDFIITNALGENKSFEVKWCYGISKYNNLFLEYENPRSH